MYAVTPPSPFEHGRFASIALVPGAPVAAEPLERLCKGQGSSQDALSDELVGEEDGRISPVALRCMSDYFAQSRSLAADHISSLLELLAFFVFNGMFDLAHRHMESRLDWLPDYRDTLRKKAAHCRFYCELLDVIISLVASPMQRELIGHYCNGAGGPGGAGGAKGAKGAGGPDGAGGTGSAASPR
jgi:hypothetical protein